MSSNEIQKDIQTRKGLLSSVTAYGTLRKRINILCYFYIGSVILWALINLSIMAKSRVQSGAISFSAFVIALMSIIFALVIRDLAYAFLDGVDLKLLDNRRSEISRKEESE